MVEESQSSYSQSKAGQDRGVGQVVPSSPAFKNQTLLAATKDEYFHEAQASPTRTQSKAMLLQQLNIDGVGGQGVKIYNSGGIKFKVKDTDITHEVIAAKKANKAKLNDHVQEKVKELEGSFARQADLIQKAVEKETENAYGGPIQQENVMKLDTANFIRTIQEHMEEDQGT